MSSNIKETFWAREQVFEIMPQEAWSPIVRSQNISELYKTCLKEYGYLVHDVRGWREKIGPELDTVTAKHGA